MAQNGGGPDGQKREAPAGVQRTRAAGGRRRRVAVLCVNPWVESASVLGTFSYGAYRIQAAVMASTLGPETDVRVFEGWRWSPQDFVDAVEGFDPDVVGASCYLWSLPKFLEVARVLRDPGRRRRLFVIGGPSARPAMLNLPRHAAAAGWIDAMVTGEGEATFVELLAATRNGPADLRGVAGLALPGPHGWVATRPRGPTARPDVYPSPYQLGLAPAQGLRGHFETFRGCPVSCTFCEWGVDWQSSGVFSADYLRRDFEAMQAAGVSSLYQVDAGLNLNARAFRNLAAAEEAVGLGAATRLTCEIYPANVRDEHLALLERTHADVGVGLQSLNAEVLKGLQRPMDEARVLRGIRRIAGAAARTNVEIILGLPGDSPASFRETLHRALELERCCLRVYVCLALPDGLMTRAPARFEVAFDPSTLEVTSCLGWSRDALEEEIAYVDGLLDAGRAGARFGISEAADDWESRAGRGWFFAADEAPESDFDRDVGVAVDLRFGVAGAPAAGAAMLPGDLAARLLQVVEEASEGYWQGEAVRPDGAWLALDMTLPAGAATLRFGPAVEGESAFRVARGVAYVHQDDGAIEAHGGARTLARVIEGIDHLCEDLAAALGWPLAEEEGPPREAPAEAQALAPGPVAAAARAIAGATGGAWRLQRAERRGAALRLVLHVGEHQLTLDATPAGETPRRYRATGDIAWSYAGGDGALGGDTLARLDRTIDALGPVAAPLVGAP